MKRKKGMLPAAFKAYIQACADARLAPENIVQTVGNAKLSQGFHAADGKFLNDNGKKESYCAATDLSVRHPHELTGGQVSQLLLALFHNGFCPFWRYEGVFMEGPHIHMIWSETAMKPELQMQVEDFLQARNGLVSHALDTFWIHFIHQKAWERGVKKIRTAYLKYNPPE